MEASQNPQLALDEGTQGCQLHSVGDRVRIDAASPEGVARLALMINLVLPRLTRT